MPKPSTFSLSAHLNYFHFHKKTLMKPDTFDFKPSPSSCYTYIHSILSSSSFAYKEKNS